MPLTITHVGGPNDELIQTFDDTVGSITIGRDPEQCDVVLESDARMAGREHCTLARIRGRYIIDMAPNRVVTLGDGTLLETGTPIPDRCELIIGPNGPKLIAAVIRHSGLASTADQGLSPEQAAQRTSPKASQIDVEKAASTAQSSGRRATLVGGLTLIVLAIVVATFFIFTSDVERLEQQDFVATKRIDGVEQRSTAMEGDLVTLGAKLPNLLAEAQPSVYLVIHQGEEGGETAFGTAFVIGTDTLATNAHIAEQFESLGNGETLLLRSPAIEGDASTDIAVNAVSLHPGYGAFAELWKGYVPARLNAANRLDKVRSAGTACDIAILHVSPETPLPPALPIAGTPSHAEMAAGQVLGSIGFPMEGMALEGANLKSPVPQTQIGRITSLTTFFNTSADESTAGPGQRNMLIQHSIPGTGGASGSPILNGRGEVVGVLSAVNFAMVDGQRIPTGAGVNFAQRSTLLDELIAGNAATMLPDKLTAWQNAVRRLYVSGELLKDEAGLEMLVGLWRKRFISETPASQVAFTETILEPTYWPLDSLHAGRKMSGSGEQGYETDVVFDIKGGSHYIIAATADGDVDADFGDALRNGTIEDLSILQVGNNRRGWAFRAGSDGKLSVGLSSTSAKGEFGTTVAGGYRSMPLEGDALAAIRQQWRSSLSTEWGTKVRDIGGYVNEGRTSDMGDGSPIHTLDVPFAQQGLYMMAATSENDIDLDLRLYLNSGDERTLLGEDFTEGAFPYIVMDVFDAVTLEVEVSSPEPGAVFNVYVYRAVVRGDVDANDSVEVNDLIMTAMSYGDDCSGGQPCAADIDEDGTVGVDDVLSVIADFGQKAKEAMAPTVLAGTQIAFQSVYSDQQYAMRSMGVSNNAWCVHGSALRAGHTISLDEFLNASFDDIRLTFNNYVTNHQLNFDTTDLVVIDIEAPIAPRHLGNWLMELQEADEEHLFAEWVEAYRLRIAVTREVLPNARLGLYGMIVPHAWGDPDMESQQRNMAGYRAAEELGLYDDADALITIIYQRFGPDDSKFDRLDEMTAMAMSESTSLLRTDGSAIPVIPMASFLIYNGGSPYHETLIEAENLLVQLDVLRNQGVYEILFWSGNDSIPNYEATVAERLQALLGAANPDS
jgi:S1-C subfamily serine protease